MNALTYIDGLNKRFGIEGMAQVVAGPGGLPVVRIHTAAAQAEISLYGAQVLSWKAAGQAEALFLSEKSYWQPGKAIRGGIPLCFPWFGDKADDPSAPKHGYARTREWRLDSMAALDDGSVTLLCVLENDAAGKAWFPNEFVAAYRITVGSRLYLELTVTNAGAMPMRFEEALHTYFRVASALQARVRGLAGHSYLDKAESYSRTTQAGDVTFGAEVDRVYLAAPGPVDVIDGARVLRTEKQNSANTVVWNPAATVAAGLADLGDEDWKHMVCVEAANVGTAALLLQPGAEHNMKVTLEVTKG